MRRTILEFHAAVELDLTLAEEVVVVAQIGVEEHHEAVELLFPIQMVPGRIMLSPRSSLSSQVHGIILQLEMQQPGIQIRPNPLKRLLKMDGVLPQLQPLRSLRKQHRVLFLMV